MPKVKDWGLSDTSEPETLDAFEPYDGEDPPKGVYKFRLTMFRVKANKNDDPMLNGLLILQDDREGKSDYNGWGLWFNENVTDTGKPFVKRLLNALGVSWNDLMNKTIIREGAKWPKSNGDEPAPIEKIGTVKFSANDVMVRANIGKRRGEGDDMEVKTWLPWKDDDEDDSDGTEPEPDEADEAADDADDSADDGDGDEPEEAADGDSEGWTREDLEELSIVSDDETVYGLAEILDEAGVEYDSDREDEEYYIALILEEEPPEDPRAKKAAKKTAKKAPAKKTAAKKGSKPPF